jgi:DNA repair exonuclease SbcCD ATPase subunit
MSFRTPYIKIFAFLFYLVFVTSYSPAQSDPISLNVQSFVRDGLNAHERHDILKAIDNFSRALLIDPTQKIAREHLAIINGEEHLPVHQKAQLFLLEDLSVFLENLRARTEYFKGKCDGLKGEFLKQGYTQTYINHQLSDIKSRFFRPSRQSDVKEEQTDPLEAVNASLTLEKEWLSHELFYTQKQYAWLKELSKKTSAILSVEMIVDGESFMDQVIWPATESGGTRPLDITPPSLDDAMRKRDKIAVKAIPETGDGTPSSDVRWGETHRQIAMLQEELEHLRQEMNGLKQHAQESPDATSPPEEDAGKPSDDRQTLQLNQQYEAKAGVPRQNQPARQGKDQRLEDLTGQVIDFSLKLAEKEMVLSDKIEALTSLNKAYDDLQSRFDLGHKIIQEKNVQIQYLSESLDALETEIAVCSDVSPPLADRKESGARMAPQAARLAEMDGIIRMYADKMEDAGRLINAQNAAISALEEQVTVVRAKLFEKETAFEKIQKKLADMERQLERVQGQWLKTEKETMDGLNRHYVFFPDSGY